MWVGQSFGNWVLPADGVPVDAAPKVKRAFRAFFHPKVSHCTGQVIEPETLSYRITDPPAGLLA